MKFIKIHRQVNNVSLHSGKKQHSKWIDPLEDANTYVEVFGGASVDVLDEWKTVRRQKCIQ